MRREEKQLDRELFEIKMNMSRLSSEYQNKSARLEKLRLERKGFLHPRLDKIPEIKVIETGLNE